MKESYPVLPNSAGSGRLLSAPPHSSHRVVPKRSVRSATCDRKRSFWCKYSCVALRLLNWIMDIFPLRHGRDGSANTLRELWMCLWAHVSVVDKYTARRKYGSWYPFMIAYKFILTSTAKCTSSLTHSLTHTAVVLSLLNCCSANKVERDRFVSDVNCCLNRFNKIIWTIIRSRAHRSGRVCWFSRCRRRGNFCPSRANCFFYFLARCEGATRIFVNYISGES